MKYFQILLLLGINFSTILLGQSIEIPHKMMKQDTTINIPIFIYDVSELVHIDLTIKYDESIVLAENIIQNPLGILVDGDYTFQPPNISEQGIIHLVIYSNSTNMFSGSGMVAQITFKSIGNLGEFSSLIFQDAQINSDWGVSSFDGYIEIILDELTITGQDNSGIGAEHSITLGLCDGCSDGWKFGEDEDDYPDPQDEYTNIHFYHPEWLGQEDVNGNICNQFEFSSDYRKQHSFQEVTNWGIRGSTGGGLAALDIPIKLSWDSNKLNTASDNFQMFIYVGETGYDMQEMDDIIVSKSELTLNEYNEPNIWVEMGGCSGTAETATYYKDFDGDGLGSGITAQFCSGDEPDGWVTNSDDEDDYCYSNHYDCIGDCDGTAVEDCNGVCGGSAIEDECSVCNGDNSFCTDCHLDLGGPNGIPFDGDEAYLDGCGGCVGGDTENDACLYDCSGEPNGTSTIDNCGTCDDNSSNDCVQDCAGTWGGSFVNDECGICDGPGFISECECDEIPDDDCDCDGNELDQCGICDGDNITCTDCAGIPNGSGSTDECGVCDDDPANDCTPDCAGVWGGDFIIDECGVCGGSGIPDGDCDCEGNKFDKCGECGGDGSSDLGCGCFEPGPSGCDNQCNSTAEIDCAGECGGHAVVDDCGVCEGGDLDMDCNGECGGIAELDICGVCEGDGIPSGECDCDGNVLDCAGVCGGSAIEDKCGVCENYEARPEYPYGNCDCNGVVNGDDFECTGVCNGDAVEDCAGVCRGSAIEDNCGVCAGGTTDVHPCVEDCVGTCTGNGNTTCVGGGNDGGSCTTTADCPGIPGGTFWVSDCGCVEADNSGDECDDCAGNPNGTAELDLCGNCIEEETDTNFECSEDCNGVWGGTHPPTFTCQNSTIACNYGACNNLTNDDLLLPNKFDINRIYPNPFNPQATIDFEVSEPTMVQLNIYNLKGQKVEVLKDAFTLPGHYSVIWNGTNHPSGIYFVILQSSNSIVKQKMMLIK